MNAEERERLTKLYADVGGIDAVPAALLELLPRDKFDEERAERLLARGYPALDPVLPHLLMWLQDWNWPVSRPIATWLSTVGTWALEPVRQVLRSGDDIWVYWVLVHVVAGDRALRDALQSELKRFVDAPTPSEVGEEIPEIAAEILEG